VGHVVNSTRAFERLENDDIIRCVGGVHRTTRRWQGAMARAVLRVSKQGGDCEDIRVPIASALVEIYAGAPDEELVELVDTLLRIEAAELDPRAHIAARQ
jgi:hypothetical protein